jgi:hypothetical protein
MKVLFFMIISVLLLESCGKKSDPKYQSKNEEIIIILS